MSRTLGRWVRFLREDAGVKQADLAQQAGWNAPALNRLELHGIWPADPAKLERLLDALAEHHQPWEVRRASDIWYTAAQSAKDDDQRTRLRHVAESRREEYLAILDAHRKQTQRIFPRENDAHNPPLGPGHAGESS